MNAKTATLITALNLVLFVGIMLGQTSSDDTDRVDTNQDGRVSALEFAAASVEPLLHEQRVLLRRADSRLERAAKALERMAAASEEPRDVIIHFGRTQSPADTE